MDFISIVVNFGIITPIVLGLIIGFVGIIGEWMWTMVTGVVLMLGGVTIALLALIIGTIYAKSVGII